MRPGAADVPSALGRRAERAAALAGSSEAAAEPLRFAAGLYRIQADVARALEGRPLVGRLAEDLPLVPLRAIRDFAAERGPEGLRAAARVPASDEAAVVAFWRGDRSGAGDYLARAQLRPYVETLAARGLAPETREGGGGCGFCGGQFWVGLRRPGEGDAARRLLGCALCGGEEAIGRIICPGCGEGEPEKLPIFQTERYPAARLEACSTCRRYVKSIDLTVDGRALPEVDDLVSLALDLWAVDEGYVRLEPGLAGI